ncbi:uncharacterized protein ACNS7B_013839 [Menidia menidia]
MRKTFAAGLEPGGCPKGQLQRDRIASTFHAVQPEGQYWLPALLWSPSTIPFPRDVQTLYAFLERCSASAVEGLEAREGPEPYSSLCTATLAQAYVLSKGSPEVSKMTLKCFQERGDSTQVLSRHFIRINTEGQQSVLLTSQLVAVLTLLIGKRAACRRETPSCSPSPPHPATSWERTASALTPGAARPATRSASRRLASTNTQPGCSRSSTWRTTSWVSSPSCWAATSGPIGNTTSPPRPPPSSPKSQSFFWRWRKVPWKDWKETPWRS